MEWISVKDRLPEHGEIVLCIGVGHRPSIAKYTGVFERYIDVIEGDRFLLIHYDMIRLWMPMPILKSQAPQSPQE